jgi:succinate dehydrogenase hydrophobic anchor subunit
MTFFESFVLFIAIVFTTLTVSSYIHSFIGIAVIKDNYIDRNWVSRLISLIISAASISGLLYLWS